ncbi:PR domain zinc finger protein 2 [Trichomycterus rosablanca]|uniref:PR domain zinc finger protein 2 n=1 Tax=Trichomycterus rosablanca TaxID=2290929 RepID=UPI002F3513D4
MVKWVPYCCCSICDAALCNTLSLTGNKKSQIEQERWCGPAQQVVKRSQCDTCDSENVKTDELPVSPKEKQQSVTLCPTENRQLCHTGKHLLYVCEEVEVGENVGEPDKTMEHCVEDLNISHAETTRQPPMEDVPLLTMDVINQHPSCQTNETEDLEITKPEHGSDFSSETGANQAPDCDPESNPDTDLQGLCSFFCQHCQRRFSTRQGLECHIHTPASCHTQTFKCRHCRMCFRTQFGRRRHERRHDSANRTGVLKIPSVKRVGENTGVVTSEEKDQSALSSQPVVHLSGPNSVRTGGSDGSGDAKGAFVCKYCKKAYGTHTNLRRHERRIHERRLLPRSVNSNAKSPQELQSQQPDGLAEASLIASTHPNEETKQEEYMVDISSNISENLSFYIDGKIISTSAVTNCEVMEVNSASTVLDLDALIINPCHMTLDPSGQPSVRRRTSTPPLLPQIKIELESESILTTSSSNTEGTLIGTVLPRPLETIVFQKDKMIYLSPKLKQLLQNQGNNKSTFSLFTEGQKFCPSLTVLPATTSRFRRRTSSPPLPSQQSTTSELNTTMAQEELSPVLKVPEMDIHYTSSAVINLTKKDEIQAEIPPINDNAASQHVLPLDCSASGTGGRSCNQQPLDLSNTVAKNDPEVFEECALDLSMNRKSSESDSPECSAFQLQVRRTKPNSSMLEKVLLDQYAVVDVPAIADALITSDHVVTNPAVMTDPVNTNPERVMFELSPASSDALHLTPSALTPAVLHTVPLTQTFSELNTFTQVPNEVFVPVSTPITSELVRPSSDAQCSIPVVPPAPVEMTVGNPLTAFNVSIPDWLNCASGGMTHALLPTALPLGLQGPQISTDPSGCELAQRTLVMTCNDSVLSPEAQLFSPSLLINQANITSLSIPPNVFVIEYTVALESTNSNPVLQTNAINCLFDKTPPEPNDPPELQSSSQPLTDNTEPSVPELTEACTDEPQDLQLDSPTNVASLDNPEAEDLSSFDSNPRETMETEPALTDGSTCSFSPEEASEISVQHHSLSEEQITLPRLCKRFLCNACDESFQSMKGLSQHISEHSDTWPYKCEFCVQLFESETGLLEHRSSYHGIGKIYVCRVCSKEFAFLCNLEQHHRDLHPGQECSHTEVENGKLRPENHNSPLKVDSATSVSPKNDKNQFKSSPKAEEDTNSENTTEEIYTTIKIMATEGVKPKGTDVRLGINQHYPSFKPPPFPYHNRSPVGMTNTTATNFSTHNIPQTFSTTIRCTKCGQGFDNMPELHTHILACANASDKKRYTPKKNPIPLKQIAKVQNGVLLPARGVNLRQNASQKLGQLKKFTSNESDAKMKLNSHNKKKSLWVHRGKPVGRKASQEGLEVFNCPHCSREFTYPASLKKHMAISCPLRPVCRKLKKRKASMALAQENNGRFRPRVAEVIMKSQRLNQGQKTIAKIQTKESGSAKFTSLPVKTHIGKGKITVHNFRPKRSDVLSGSAVHLGKKSKLILMEAIQSPLASNKYPTTIRKLQQLSNRVQGVGREIKQDEVEMRERTAGPVTRSLQQANGTLNNTPNNTNKRTNHGGMTDRQNGTANQPGVDLKKSKDKLN